jgi:hypothetical protein
MIASYCDQDSVKLLRHVDRQFYNVVIALISEHITICYVRQKRAECLDLLAQNPYIRRCIRRLTWRARWAGNRHHRTRRTSALQRLPSSINVVQC